MKDYLGIREIGLPYMDGIGSTDDTMFGINPKERNFVRVRVAEAAR